VKGSRRRQLLAGGAVLLAAPAIALAQPRARRIGVLMPSTAASTANLTAALEQGLRELGYSTGENLAVEYRYSGGDSARIAALAQELTRARVEVVVTTTDEVVRSTAQHSGSIPIVMVNASDPIGNGLVKSLGHPGGKITGITNLSPEVTGKRIELLRDCFPGLRRVVYLWNAGLRGAHEVFREVETAARRLGLRMEAVEVRSANDIRDAFARLATGAGDGLLVQAPNPLLYTERALICALANAARLPSMFNRTEYLAAGGLASYGPNVPEMYRRAASYVDRILKGESPATLPVEQPSKFELAVSLRTARSLGLEIPQAVLARADKIVR
jgi:putative ABC transport system substrate-binding protein